MPYSDLQENFPEIFASLKSTYYDGLESYRIPSDVKWTRKHSRTSVKQTQKKQASQRKIHALDNAVYFPLPDKDKTLVLNFKGYKRIGYIAETNQGKIAVLYMSWCKTWVSCFADNTGKILLIAESTKSYQESLAMLCGLRWGSHKFSDKTLSLYDIYKTVFFNFSDNNAKRPRNNTLKLRLNTDFNAVWDVNVG